MPTSDDVFEFIKDATKVEVIRDREGEIEAQVEPRLFGPPLAKALGHLTHLIAVEKQSSLENRNLDAHMKAHETRVLGGLGPDGGHGNYN